MRVFTPGEVAANAANKAWDGSASGFWTQVRYGIPVLTVVWNNLNYQTVRHAYHSYAGRMAKSGPCCCSATRGR